MYNFDALRLYLRLVPWFLRKPIFTAWLTVIASALEYVQGILLAFVTETEYDLLFNAQIIYFETVLNETFDPVDETIYIENVFLPPLYFYNLVEAQPPIYLRNASEGEDPFYMRNAEEYISATQYIIHLPAALAGQEAAIIALVELYNLAGMNYELAFDL